MKQTVCVDLDGVLARFDEWHGVDYFGDVNEFLENNNILVTSDFAEVSEYVGYSIDISNVEAAVS